MLCHCNNVTSLGLPLSLKIDCEELKIALKYMEHLENLEVQLCTDIEPLFHIGKLKNLTVHISEEYHSYCGYWVQKWVRNKYIPYNLNLVAAINHFIVEASRLIELFLLDFTPLTDYTSCFKWYRETGKPPLDLYPLFPEFQAEIGETLILPAVEPSNFGILGLPCNDTFGLTDCIYNGKKSLQNEV